MSVTSGAIGRSVLLQGAEEVEDLKNCRYTNRKPNIWDRVTFGFLTGIILKGSWGTIQARDLNPLHTLFTAEDASNKLLRLWSKKYNRFRHRDGNDTVHDDPADGADIEVLIRPDAKPTKINMVWLIFRTFWPHFLFAFFCKILQMFIDLIPPYLIGRLLDFLENEEQPQYYGYGVAGVLFLAQQTSSFLQAHIYGTLFNIGIKCRSGFSSVIYQKALRLSSKSSKEFSTGDIINLVSVDLENVMWSTTMSVCLWGSPINMLLTFVMIYQYLGIYSLAAAVAIVLFAPFSALMAKIESALQDKHMKKKDERIELLTELFNNIKVIKLYAWENSFMDRVKNIRTEESRLMYIYLGACNAFGFVWNCFPFIISAAALGAYIFLNTSTFPSPKMVLVSLSYFSNMRFDLTAFPYAVSSTVKAVVSLKRIRKFLEADEVDPCVIQEDGLDENEEIALKNATFAWTDEDDSILSDVSLSIKKGELVAVVGSVAAGKSSLIQAIIGEMNLISGSIHKKRTSQIAYVPQQAWILNNTIRKNILFDQPYRGSAYQDIVRKCCLIPDLKTLPAGDGTEIGEKGINLSGGQKQRVSLARAVYHDADIYLLDDPLSAVDAHVAQSLFNDIIGPTGLLRNKTRLLVTHSIAFLPKVDRIIVLEEGRVTHQGTYPEIMKGNVHLKELIETHAKPDIDDTLPPSYSTYDGNIKLEMAERLSLNIKDDKPLLVRKRTTSVSSINSTGSGSRQLSDVPSGRITDEEEVQVGKVRWTVYVEFLWKFGIFGIFFVLAGYITFRTADALSLRYITLWAAEMHKNRTSNEDMWQHIEVYLAYGGVQAISILVGLTALSLGCIWTSSALHNKMLLSILRAPMNFFDSTPTGRILNRFSRDVDELDLNLYSTADGYLETTVGLTILLTMVCIQIPIFLCILAPLLVLFLMIQQFYMASSRQVKRLNAITKSPVLNSFSESIAGTVSIRAYSMEGSFTARNMQLLDNNQNCMFHEYNGYRWLAIRLNIIGQLMDTAVCCILVFFSVKAELGALILSYALEASMALTWVTRLGAQVENSLVSAERVLEYGKTKPEADWVVKQEQVDPSWPSRGEVRFENYSTRYRENLAPVLRGINLEINAGQRIGIVGRTGAGKSSLTLALLRIMEATEGRICIDGVDIAKLGLHTLRSRVAVIPQDPVLFKGPLRDNVDPENKYSDEQIWTALEKAHLKTKDKPISYQVEEGGANLSVGERQLVCLARALLRQSNLIILDEATAAVDLDTDKLIQKTIRDDFTASTVITIAHRLHTILDYDKVVVLDKGQVTEVGTPQELLDKHDGIFSSMAKDANIKTIAVATSSSSDSSTLSAKIVEEPTQTLEIAVHIPPSEASDAADVKNSDEQT
ncbi:multidrug resistance-associated protein 1-like isoform X1 [Varroa jacobsoni]|uniref:multidrug resistance-associated protein 1-like isoform X1 n=1 Tax=Varroa jacobsoni TaxID=62625 RepID=UPI000BF52F13|nr:multidrug resistance-associated protein 1-like isoform X1 [Varroa jacobsoni]